MSGAKESLADRQKALQANAVANPLVEDADADADTALGSFVRDARGQSIAKQVQLKAQHFAAMVMKRIQFSRRDKMHQCCGTVCPSVALLCGLLMISSANSALNQPAFELDMSHLNGGNGNNNIVPFVLPDGSSASEKYAQASTFRAYLNQVGGTGGTGPARFADYTAEVRARVADDRDKEVRWPTAEHSSALYLNGMGKGD